MCVGDDDDEDNDIGSRKKRKYKKVDIKQGEKDYQKWMSQLQ